LTAAFPSGYYFGRQFDLIHLREQSLATNDATEAGNGGGNPVDISEVRARLAEIDGVERVVIDEEHRQLVLVLQAGAPPHHVEEAARAMVSDEAWQLYAVFRPEQRDRQRVRFIELRREVQPDQQIAFTVNLEWAGEDYTGTAAGEKGDAVELRTAALAALRGVAHLAPPDLQLRLAGVKLVRAFDAEMVVVSLYRPDAEPHNLVGAVVAGQDAPRAAALSVLTALNRLLGNYLIT
jgi:hypothetical protein